MRRTESAHEGDGRPVGGIGLDPPFRIARASSNSLAPLGLAVGRLDLAEVAVAFGEVAWTSRRLGLASADPLEDRQRPLGERPRLGGPPEGQVACRLGAEDQASCCWCRTSFGFAFKSSSRPTLTRSRTEIASSSRRSGSGSRPRATRSRRGCAGLRGESG